MGHRRIQFCCMVTLLGILALSTGCRNRESFLANNSFSSLRGSTTVAPPNTYTLQIPGQPNVNQANTMRQASNVQPNNVNVQGGWQPAGSATGQNSTTTTTPPANNGASTNSTIAQNQTRVVSVAPPNRQPFQRTSDRVAQNTTGLSYTDATNFRTTAIDERLDQSRLPVTDASQVRAPSSFSPATTVGQFNAPYYVPNRQPVNNVLPQYQNTQQRFATNPQNGQYLNPNLTRNGFQQNTVVGAFGQPAFTRPPQQRYSGLNTRNQVLAQATVYADPANDPNLQSGWTDRELTASRSSLNR